MLSSSQETCPTLVDTDWHRHGSFCCLVTRFGTEWKNSSVLGSFSQRVKHFRRRCRRRVILDGTWTQVVMLSTVELLFWVKRPQILLVAVAVSKILWGANISFCVQEMKSMDLGSVPVSIKEACPAVFILDMRSHPILKTERVAAATWPLLWGAFHLFLLPSAE